MKTLKLLILAVVAMILAACNTNEPTKAFEGTWVPVVFEDVNIPDVFIITSDSIKGILYKEKIEYYFCHYKVVRKGVVELERCWAKQRNFPETFWFAKVPMYIDEQGYLIIEDFDPSIELEQIYPNYANLKLKKYEEN